jgi:predicted RNA-binding Zn ribbon-like protein
VTDALHAIEQHHVLDPGALGTINEILASDAGFDHLERRRGTTYAMTYQRVRSDLDHAFAPIARDTARLLSTPNAPVRHCAGEGCVRHFFDDSRTGRRRWCEMAVCGNRAKVAAFTARRAGSDRA